MLRAVVALTLVSVAQAKLDTVNPTICDPNVKQYAGWYKIDGGSKSYFYWAFEARQKTTDTPTILWMTGGPGCSSELAALYENGPCHVNSDAKTTRLNPYSWNQNANLVYIDQPAGVGFSYGTQNDTNEKDVANDMYNFLQALFQEHPEWNTKFYVFGESYGGHYAPATAHRVWQGGRAGEGIKINLAGLAVGNGLTDPEIQYKYYPQMAYNWSIEVQKKPVVSLETYQRMEAHVPQCIDLIKECNRNGRECNTAKTYCNEYELSPYTSTGLNPYDITKKCEVQPLCYNFTAINDYLNSDAVQTQLGIVPHRRWKSCNYQVNADFGADWMHDYQTMVPDLLENGVRVLIYAGDVDYVCNWLGNKAWTLALEWSGKNGFNGAADKNWMVSGSPAGKVRTYQTFTFLQVSGAGHMVPADKPEQAQEMVHSFIFDQPF